MNRYRMSSLVVVLTAAACSASGPTEAERMVPGGPALDGGVMHGSGNWTETDTTGVNTTAATSSEVTATETDRSGVMHGSGN
jgi:hypothetical protein